MKLFLTTICLAGATLLGAAENLIKNPGFEQGGNWWYKNKIFSIQKNASNRVFRIASEKETKPVFAEQTPDIPVTAGETYEFSCRFKNKTKSGNVHFLFLIRDNNNRCIVFLKSPEIKGKSDGSWENLQYSFTIPAKGMTVQLRIYAGMSFAGEVELDDLVLKKGKGEITVPELSKKTAMNRQSLPFLEKNALILNGFCSFPGAGDKAAVQKTELYLAAAEDNLCGCFKLFHAPGTEFQKVVSPRDNETLLWKNEVLELFITHINSEMPLYQIAFDPHGQIYDASGDKLDWNCNIKIRSEKLSNDCTLVFFELPLSDIGYHYENKGGGMHFRLNAARNHSTLGASMSPISVWLPAQNLRDVKTMPVFTIQQTNKPKRISGRNIGSAAIEAFKDPARWWKVEDPLFKELISDKPAPFPGLRMFSWVMPIQHHRNRDYALQYGRTFNFKERLAEYDRSGIRHLEMYHRTPDKKLLPWMDEKKGRSVMLLYFSGNAVFDSYRMFEGLADEAKQELDKNPGRYSGVAMPDEYLSALDTILISTAKNPKTAASMKKILQEIREKYGYGKFDIPSAPESDTEPFARLATRKYLLDRIVLAQKKLMELCKEHQNKTGNLVQVISSDPTSQLRIQHQSRVGAYADMVNVQSGPANSEFRQRSGFGAKLVTDLSGKPAFCYVHLENLNNVSYDAEASASLLSEAFRAGAVGVALYPVDWAGVTRRYGSTNTDAYGHPPRWTTILETAKIINNMNLLKFPEPDYAVFVSNDSALSRRRWEATQYEAFYNLAGPGARTWFRFISDIQLLDGKEKLSKWKFVVIPKADIVDEKLYPFFEEYVKNGGTLVCYDPDFSKFRPDGNSGLDFSEKLFGVTVRKTKFYDRIRPDFRNSLMKGLAKELPLAACDFKLEGKGVKVLASSTVGDAFMTEKSYPNGGRAIMIARELNHADGARSEWHRFNKKFLENLGAKTGHNIWRFTFPHKKVAKPKVSGKCLTGNHFIWWRDKAELTANEKVSPNANYTLTLAPDVPVSKNLTYKFDTGNWTNRAKAFTAGDLFNELKNRFIIREGKIRLDMFADTFSKTDAFQARFNFGKKVPVRRVRIFWSGNLPEVTVTTGDGRTARCSGAETEDVNMAEITLPRGSAADTVTVSFGQRPVGKKLIISEIEIWD